jgi:hypothetical protein
MAIMQTFKQGLEIWSLQIRSGGNTGNLGIFTHSNTANRTYTLPDNSGTIALLSDIGISGNNINLDGGIPTSNYGGISPLDCGGPV